MAENRRKSENIRRANRVIQTRTFVLMLVLGVAVFLVLALKLYQLQIKQHDYYQSKALDQQTRSTVVTASRGTIYDRNGNELAVSATAETVFLSPKELAEELEKPETKWTKESLSAGLSQLLGVTQESILEQMERTYSQYEVVKLRVDEDTANAVREFLNDNEVHGVYLETDAKRYYPYGSLAAHVIGFVGTDNTGLYGLEAQYEEELQGQTGLVVSAKDNGGNALPYEYEQYYASHNGDDLVLTLDTNVQYYLEKYVKEMADQFEAANGATGIVMDVKTGGVLGMVSYPNYDLNNYSEVSDARLKAAIEDGSASLADQQLRQWRNKALNDTYEPGSTFKILTLSAALEEGVVDMSSTFECSGSITVMGQTIHCSNTSGHGHQTLKEATGNSCNPAFINCGLGLGTDTFYEYMRSFGLLEGSGIDLAGEATGIFMAQSDFSQLDLACYAFGQNFNVTPISLIAAQAACINGGYLYQPHVVEQIRDSSGAVVYQHDNTPVRQVSQRADHRPGPGVSGICRIRRHRPQRPGEGLPRRRQNRHRRQGPDRRPGGLLCQLCPGGRSPGHHPGDHGYSPAAAPAPPCPAAAWWPLSTARSWRIFCPIWASSPPTAPRSCWARIPPFPMSSADTVRMPGAVWRPGASPARW